jgi:hypothetical protein
MRTMHIITFPQRIPIFGEEEDALGAGDDVFLHHVLQEDTSQAHR